jgi:segregation and condensation protein B
MFRRPGKAEMELKAIVEAALFAAQRPLNILEIEGLFPEDEKPETSEIVAALEDLAQDYRTRPIELKQVASGYRFQVREALSPWVSRLFEERPARYSKAFLETLAIIAYRQPVTRGEIEDIRGVSVSTHIIRALLEREWVQVVGHKEVPGRPALYATTRQFLDYFNLQNLDDLPPLQALIEQIAPSDETDLLAAAIPEPDHVEAEATEA